MREIKIRAKDIISGNWVYGTGYVIEGIENYCIVHNHINVYGKNVNEHRVPQLIVVEKETISQYTGLKDKNGVTIYENDTITNGKYTWTVMQRGDFWTFSSNDGSNMLAKGLFARYNDEIITQLLQRDNGKWAAVKSDNMRNFDIEVIGNIHDKE